MNSSAYKIKTRVIKVGNVLIGGDNPIVIQSMTNTKTKDVTSTVNQINALENIGCQIARVAILDMEDAKAITKIKQSINIPLVADIHFDYKLALAAIEAGADKIRINPGNIGSVDHVRMIVEACKDKNIPIRIGVNSGSLEKEYLNKYGKVTADALVESTLRSIRILEYLNFHDIVVSIKASNVMMTIEAYEKIRLLVDYPIHIGITESGSKTSGTIKSSIGLGILLNEGIGETIRVSLSSDPLDEIKVAKEILSTFGLYKKPCLIACPTCGRTQYNMFPIVDEIEKFLDTLTNTDIKVAIMGCAVNGPGEAREADLGIAGGKNEALFFKNKEIIRKIPQEHIVEELKKEILEYIKKA